LVPFFQVDDLLGDLLQNRANLIRSHPELSKIERDLVVEPIYRDLCVYWRQYTAA
jgi:hypothetical protein